MTTEFVSTCKSSGGDYSTISTWHSNVQCDITATTTKVYGHAGKNGSIADGNSVEVVGATSNTATIAGVTATQILLESISGTISNGDTIQKVGDAASYVDLNTVADDATPVLEIDNFDVADSEDITGFTTDATNYWIIRPIAGAQHTGTPGTGARCKSNPGQYTAVIGWGDYCQVIGIEFEHTRTGSTSAPVIASNSNFYGYQLIVKSVNHSGISKQSNFYLYSSLIYECAGDGIYDDGTFKTGGEILGCTFVDNGDYGFDSRANGTVKMAGCVGYNNTSGLADTEGTFLAGSDYNATDSGAWTDVPGGNTGNSINNLSATETDVFEDPTNDDYSLASGSALEDAWSASPGYAFDIINTSRPQDSTADIGAFETVAGGGPAVDTAKNLLLTGAG